MTIVKNVMDFECSLEVLYVTNIFDLHIIDKETAAFLNFFEIYIEKQLFLYFF